MFSRSGRVNKNLPAVFDLLIKNLRTLGDGEKLMSVLRLLHFDQTSNIRGLSV